MKHHVSQTLYRYWDTLRAGQTAPERADVDPAAIRHILAYTFILEVAGGRARGRDIRFRLCGTRLNALFGRDLRGCALDEILARHEAPGAEALLQALLDDRLPIVARTRGAPPGSDPIDLELLLLPLRHHGRAHLRVLGSLAATGHPAWMGLRATAPLSVVDVETLAHRARPADAVTSGRPWPTPAVPHPPLRAGVLKVIQGGRSDARPRIF